jgi:hypothetical protein
MPYYSSFRSLTWKATKQQNARNINPKVRGEKDGAIQPDSKPGHSNVEVKWQTRSLNGRIPEKKGRQSSNESKLLEGCKKGMAREKWPSWPLPQSICKELDVGRTSSLHYYYLAFVVLTHY